MKIKVALPKGRLLGRTAELLAGAGWGLEGYTKELPLYHLKTGLRHVSAKVFHEKDIPVQVAIGNYDLGICGLDWIEELLAKYPGVGLVKIKDLGFGDGALYVAANPIGEICALERIKAGAANVRIASEYPNLAESFALKNRLGRFSVFPVWGAAGAYPPESADLALVSETELAVGGMVPLGKVLDYSAFLIANRSSWEARDLYEAVATIPAGETGRKRPVLKVKAAVAAQGSPMACDAVRLALPDGHQQKPTVEILNKAGIRIDDYPSPSGNRRPNIGLAGVSVKVIRPQDMPQQVANGNFDLAITGRDWLREHLYQFPASPVVELADLRFGWVKLVAVVAGSIDADDLPGLRQFAAGRASPLRVASEYTNIADKYARDNHLGPYRVVPTWGATEAFLPDDADMLIENTQTGGTIARHKLKIIDTLFESTACLVGNRLSGAEKRPRMESITAALKQAVS